MREIYLPAADSQLLCLGEQVLGFYSLHEGSLAALFVAPEIGRASCRERVYVLV